MKSIAVKNKLLFWMATAATALFLMVTIVPSASAEAPETDTTPPDDVENLQIEVYDEAVMLSWDVATDDAGVVGYRIYSGPDAVTAEDGEYSYDVVDAGDVIEFVVTDLPNGDDIYFAITAYDLADNESENYSNEVYGAPDEANGPAPELEHAAADEEPPTVSDALALDSERVSVVFNEAVVLPAEGGEFAFNIVDNATDEVLEVLAVEMDPDDVIGATVILTTAPQVGASEYILTAGIQIEDTSGNPIISGTSDTAAFIGSTIEPGSDLTSDLPEDDFDSPTVVSATSTGETTMEVVFSEPVILDSDPTLNFYVAEEADAGSTLDVLSVSLDETLTVATLVTEPQAEVPYSVIVTDILDEAGNAVSELENSATFDGMLAAAADDDDLADDDDDDVLADDDDDDDDSVLALTPENVKNFVAAIVTNLVVKLTWNLPEDATIIDQILYKSTDGGVNYDAGTSLGAEREEVEVTGLTPGLEYFFKLTTKDVDGMESEGMITSIKLPDTGAGMGFMAAAALGLAAFRRKKRK